MCDSEAMQLADRYVEALGCGKKEWENRVETVLKQIPRSGPSKRQRKVCSTYVLLLSSSKHDFRF